VKNGCEGLNGSPIHWSIRNSCLSWLNIDQILLVEGTVTDRDVNQEEAMESYQRFRNNQDAINWLPRMQSAHLTSLAFTERTSAAAFAGL